MPHALSNLVDGQIPGERYVGSAAEMQPGEVMVSDTLYNPTYVWDVASHSLRPRTASETLEKARADNERRLHADANAEFMASEQVFQGLIVGCLWAHNNALNATEQAIFDAMSARYTKLKNKITYNRDPARTQAQLNALTWTSTP